MIYWILGSLVGVVLLTAFIIWLCNHSEKGGQ